MTCCSFKSRRCRLIQISFWSVQLAVASLGFVRVITEPLIRDSFPIGLFIGLIIAKIGAYLTNFNAALLLLTMSRALWTRLSMTKWASFLAPDILTRMHRWSGWGMLVGAAIHISGHIGNLIQLNRLQHINWAHPTLILGFILTAILIIIGFMAYYPTIRRCQYELFRYSHYLWIFVLVLLVAHGSFCFIKLYSGRCLGSTTVYWIVGPLFFCLVDSAYAWGRSRNPGYISKVIQHPSQVIEVQVRQLGFYFVPGQYVYLCIPLISKFQWHPFTLTSSPHEDHLSMHIRTAGDWTRHFQDLLYNTRLDEIKLYLDGPYGCASQKYAKYQSVICIGAGIGQTPFAAILKSLWFQLNRPSQTTNLKKIHYVGISRSLKSLEWFSDILLALEQSDTTGLLRFHQYVTGTLSNQEIASIVSHYGLSTRDPNTGLRAHTNYGRPQWDDLFTYWITESNERMIGVFVCGPLGLCNKVQSYCHKYSNDTIKFAFHEEKF